MQHAQYISLFLVLVVNSDRFQISGVTQLPILKCSWLDYTCTLQLLLSWYRWLCTSHVLLNLLQAAATRRDQAATVVVVGVSADQVLDKIKTKVGHAGLQSLQLYKVLTNADMARSHLILFMQVGREEAGHALTHSSCDSAYPPKN